MKTLFSFIFATIFVIVLASSALTSTLAQTFPPRNTNYSFGTISSIQDDEAGNPEWIITGN
jgi:hypothetical protein